MGRSLIGEDQVLDNEFISPEEHANPSEISHHFINSEDVPITYSGSSGKFLRIKSDESGIEFFEFSLSQYTNSYPKYYIEPDAYIVVNSYGQYLIEETGYIEIAGTLELNVGAMLIIK